MKEYALTESPALKYAKISIKPFLSEDDNTGLKEYNMVVHEGIRHIDVIVCKSNNNQKTYLTGLNEFSKEVQTLDKEERQARIKEIRKIIAKAENELAGNYQVTPADTLMGPKGEEMAIEDLPADFFYTKVTTFKSIITDTFDENGARVLTFWDTFQLELDNEGLILDDGYIRDILIINAIEAGGFSLIAKDFETAKKEARYFKFYLDKRKDTAALKIAGGVLRDRAGAKLVHMYENDANKLFYITKLVSYDSDHFKMGKNATPHEALYQECSDYLAGNLHVGMTDAAKQFLEYANMDMKDLIPRVMLQDGRAYKEIMIKDGVWYYYSDMVALGKTDAECIEFLKNDLNSKTFDALQKKLHKKWSE